MPYYTTSQFILRFYSKSDVCLFQITIYKDDECVLANNSHRAKWKVINPAGNEAMVPAVCFTVPPPNKEAVDMATRWGDERAHFVSGISFTSKWSLFKWPFVVMNIYVSCSSCRIEQLYQNVLALWHHSHINMKSVVSWHYLMADIQAIRNWNVSSVCLNYYICLFRLLTTQLIIIHGLFWWFFKVNSCLTCLLLLL